MTHLRRKMLEDLERRNYSASTARCYLRAVEDFARYFRRPPDQLGPAQIRRYQAHLFRDRKLADHTVAQRLTALRFFYNKTLGRSWSVSLTPYPKRVGRLPSVLSQQEAARLIAAASPFHRMLLMTLYATGVRQAELVRLQLTGRAAAACSPRRDRSVRTKNCSVPRAITTARVAVQPLCCPRNAPGLGSGPFPHPIQNA